MRCCYLWDSEVVNQFANDQQIRRTTPKRLFSERVRNGTIKCYKQDPGHALCTNYNDWKVKHSMEASLLKDEATSKFRSIFVANSKKVFIHGKVVEIRGGIKSLDPPCQEEAVSAGDHPYTCDNCHTQLRELNDIIQHRKSGSLHLKANRLGLSGFNKRYARRDEAVNALEVETQKRKLSEAKMKQLIRAKFSLKDWEESLYSACLDGEDQRLVVNLVRLLRMGVSERNPMKIEVIRNLVSKLQRANNHRYVDLVKDISALFKNELGPTNYYLLADIFGLAKETTAANHSSQIKIDPGINWDAMDQAADTFRGLPVNEGSDGARCLRFLEPRKLKTGEIVLVGQVWEPDVSNWHEQNLRIPRKDERKNDPHDFTALKRLTDNLIKTEKLAKTVSVYNLSAIAALNKPTIINTMWPSPDRGYKAQHLLWYWEALRRACYFDSSGNVRKTPINLIGYSTDSAGFSLAAAIQLMTPTEEEIKEGIQYLALGIDEEEFASPYYWHLPSIAYLDYDHEQRLFLKNLKYDTRELTFWEDEGRSSRIATIRHLQDLKHRCQELGLDCGFNASDLLLVYFFDQNSDACERLFTVRIADLLDEHVPGSSGTSLYVRAVYHLIQPFRVPDFGSPEDVQKSVSCAITIFRLWKKVLELKKLSLHSKSGAKHNPTRRGKFMTYGCYRTAEVLFSAATIHQLAMFLHFKNLGPIWASPYNSGTKTTERIIGEMQGKTTELQNLDSQPTFGNMPERCSKVQFNLNAKQRLSSSGANVKASNKRKNMAFAFKEMKHIPSYKYPDDFKSFRAAQVKAHREGVKDGQALFSKYLPEQCVTLLKETGKRDVPYTFAKPVGFKVVDGNLPESFNKLGKSFADVPLAELESLCTVDYEEVEAHVSDEEEEQEEDQEGLVENVIEEEDKESEEGDVGGRAWKVSTHTDGRLTYLHIKRALKLLLPREYISRCRQKRNWASKYLPGKEPVNPEHDIFKYCDIALKVTQDGKNKYRIGRVEAMESTKDGSEVFSFQLKSKASVRIRCSMYCREENEIYFVPEDVLLSNWKSQSSIIGSVNLQPIPGKCGIYTLHPASKESLLKLKISPYNVDDGNSDTADESCGPSSSPIDDEFYEVEDVIDRKLSKDAHCYEYKVRFKGYGSEDDMWLPASFFNRAIHFDSTSKFGRKTKHTVDPENVMEGNKRAKRRASYKRGTDAFGSEKREKQNKGKQLKRRKNTKENGGVSRPSASNSSVTEPKAREVSSETDGDIVEGTTNGTRHSKTKVSSDSSSVQPKQSLPSGNRNVAQTKKSKKGNKGKLFRSSNLVQEQKVYTTSMGSVSSEKDIPGASQATPLNVIVVEDSKTGQGRTRGNGILADVVRSNDNFLHPRRLLSQASYPRVDGTLTTFEEVADSVSRLTNPTQVTAIPPQSVLSEIEGELNKSNSSQVCFKFPGYGIFDREGIRVLGRFHEIKSLKRQVQFEEKWLKQAFSGVGYEREVTEALLDRWNKDDSFLASYGNYKITSQVLSSLVGERYLCDEIINFLIQKYRDRANAMENQGGLKILLPSFLSIGTVLRNVVERLSLIHDMERVEQMFLPVHLHQSHWGLGVLSVRENTVAFDMMMASIARFQKNLSVTLRKS